MKKHLKLIFIVTSLMAVVLSSGCGWRLKGAAALPSNLKHVHVEAQNAHGVLVTELKRRLTAEGIHLADTHNAPVSVQILEESDTRRAVAVNSGALAAEYQIALSVKYRITQPGIPVNKVPYSAIVTRTFSFNESDVVGKGEEEDLLRQEMRKELIDQLLRRLESEVTKVRAGHTSKSS